MIAANTFVALPFLVVTVEAGLRSSDRRLEDAAATLGAGLDGVPPGDAPHGGAIGGGGRHPVLARALGEFGATVTFAGSLAGRTETMPLAVFLALQSDRDAAIASRWSS